MKILILLYNKNQILLILISFLVISLISGCCNISFLPWRSESYTQIIVSQKIIEDKDRGITFQTIQDALEFAKSKNIKKVLLKILNGVYRWDIQLAQDLTILGESKKGVIINGSIKNLKGHFLHIENITFNEANDFAIAQAGGHLTLIDTYIRNIKRENPDSIYGPCIIISSGANAKLENVSLFNNNSGGIWIDGMNTKAVVRNLEIIGTVVGCARLNSDWETNGFQFLSSLTVSNHASLFAEKIHLYSNECIGVIVCRGARAHFRDQIFLESTTKCLMPSGEFRYGYNLYIYDSSVVEMQGFSCYLAGNAGIAIKNAYLTASNGYIFENPVGILLKDPPVNYNISKCIDNSVVLYDNIIRVDAEQGVPFPPSPQLGGEDFSPPQNESSSEPCLLVPWEE